MMSLAVTRLPLVRNSALPIHESCAVLSCLMMQRLQGKLQESSSLQGGISGGVQTHFSTHQQRHILLSTSICTSPVRPGFPAQKHTIKCSDPVTAAPMCLLCMCSHGEVLCNEAGRAAGPRIAVHA